MAGEHIRTVFWIAIIPAAISFLLAWLALREPEQHLAPPKKSPFFAGFRQLDKRHQAAARRSASCSRWRAFPKAS